MAEQDRRGPVSEKIYNEIKRLTVECELDGQPKDPNALKNTMSPSDQHVWLISFNDTTGGHLSLTEDFNGSDALSALQSALGSFEFKNKLQYLTARGSFGPGYPIGIKSAEILCFHYWRNKGLRYEDYMSRFR